MGSTAGTHGHIKVYISSSTGTGTGLICKCTRSHHILVVKPELARMIEYSLDRSAFTPSSVVRTSSPDTDVGGSTSSNISLHPAKMISRSITAVNLFIIDNFIFSITWFNYN